MGTRTPTNPSSTSEQGKRMKGRGPLKKFSVMISTKSFSFNLHLLIVYEGIFNLNIMTLLEVLNLPIKIRSVIIY